MNQTTIQISKDTREKLKIIGRKGQTYDEIIENLIEIAKKDIFFAELDRIADTEEFVPLDKL
jgi:predicted CopG family antitoxin